jgi:hypothetical protein
MTTELKITRNDLIDKVMDKCKHIFEKKNQFTIIEYIDILSIVTSTMELVEMFLLESSEEKKKLAYDVIDSVLHDLLPSDEVDKYMPIVPYLIDTICYITKHLPDINNSGVCDFKKITQSWHICNSCEIM